MGNILPSKNKEEPPTEEEITREHVKEFVLKLLQNKDVNISFLPDSVESKIYEKIFGLAIQEIHHLISTVKIQFLDHEITLHMNPIPKKIPLDKIEP